MLSLTEMKSGVPSVAPAIGPMFRTLSHTCTYMYMYIHKIRNSCTCYMYMYYMRIHSQQVYTLNEV